MSTTLDEPKGKAKDPQKAIDEAVMAELLRLGGGRVSDDDLVFEGKKFIIPETMTPKRAIDYLKAHIAQQEEETSFSRTFRYRPWDGANAFQEALRKVFGTAGIGKATYSFFGKNPPQLVSINVGPGETKQIPWGAIQLPTFENTTIHLGSARDKELGILFAITVNAPRKYRSHFEGLFKVVEQELRTNSIYKGQAIDGQENAEFLDLSGVDPKKVIYSDEVMSQLNANLWALLNYSDTMRELKRPLKRAVLLEGPYGTGKTLAAYLTAQVANRNGWTFIMNRPGRDDLALTMATARLYQPAVVFFEDVDTIASGNDPDAVTQLLDTFDGINAKGTEIICVLTTNHVERIHKGMVRPGRLDAIVHIGTLDKNGIQRLIESVVPENLRAKKLDYDQIAVAMEGYLPAFCKEAIDRATTYGVARTGGKPDVLDTPDFVLAAEGLRSQYDLMNEANEGKEPDPLERNVQRVMENTLAKAVIVDDEGNPSQFGARIAFSAKVDKVDLAL